MLDAVEVCWTASGTTAGDMCESFLRGNLYKEMTQNSRRSPMGATIFGERDSNTEGVLCRRGE
eukprot:scaffold65139_cov50-Cyclotella_meneghiniana.AAC.1